jgi:hypothetical protein
VVCESTQVDAVLFIKGAMTELVLLFMVRVTQSDTETVTRFLAHAAVRVLPDMRRHRRAWATTHRARECAYPSEVSRTATAFGSTSSRSRWRPQRCPSGLVRRLAFATSLAQGVEPTAAAAFPTDGRQCRPAYFEESGEWGGTCRPRASWQPC